MVLNVELGGMGILLSELFRRNFVVVLRVAQESVDGTVRIPVGEVLYRRRSTKYWLVETVGVRHVQIWHRSLFSMRAKLH